MFCVKCGTKLDSGALFCNKCGAKLSDRIEQQAPVNANGGGVIETPKIGINVNKKILMGGVFAAIFICAAIIIFGGNEVSKVKATLAALESELNKAYNLSAIVEDKRPDDTKLAALFADRATYNQSFGGVDFASDLREFQSLITVINSGKGLGTALIKNLPFVGGAVADFTESEIQKDALFDKKKWSNAMNFKINVKNVEIVSKTEATADIDLILMLELSFLRDSKILSLIGGTPDITSDRNEIPLFLELEKIDGKWKIASVEDN